MDDWSRTLRTAAATTHYLDVGDGPPVVLLHGSGPGSSAYSNWRLAIPGLAAEHRCLAPDLSGFGRTRTDRPPSPDVWRWADEVLALLEALGVGRVDLVGNSMGGAVALAVAVRAPDRVRRLATMGTVGVPFELTPGLDAVWGYRPSPEAMRELVRLFAFDPRYAEDDELVRLRYETSADPALAETYAALFPAPRQRWVDAAVIPEASLRAIRAPLLAIHGRDDRVVPLETSIRVTDLVPDSRLVVFPRCGHWVQVERATEFASLVGWFLDRPDDGLTAP